MVRHLLNFVFVTTTILITNTKSNAQCGTINGLPDTVYIINSGNYTPSPTVTLGSSYTLFDTTWNASPGISNPNVINPTLTGPNNYVLNVLGIGNTNLVVNGDFSAGNTGFTSQYIVGTGGTWGLLSNPGTYAITTDPNLVHTNFISMGDHTTGLGNMLVVNGASIANVDLWCQNVVVTPNTDYYFSLWGSSVVGGSPGMLTFKINGNNIGPVFSLDSSEGNWEQYYATWNSGTNTNATICISNQNTTGSGNDFALDDIMFSDFCKVSDSVTLVNVDFTNTLTHNCIKDTFFFNSSNIGAFDSIVWNLGDGTTAYGKSIYHIYNANGIYTVKMTVYYQGLSTMVIHTITNNQTNNIPILTAIKQDVKCFGDSTGSIDIQVTNTSFPISSQINGGGYQNGILNFENLSTGNYTIEVKNTIDCIGSINVNINEPPPLTVEYNAQNISCHNLKDGSITLNLTGGVPPYFQNNTLVNLPITMNNLYASSYPFRFIDSNKCKLDTTITISQPDELKLIANGIKHTTCFVTPADGKISVEATGGTKPYTFYINGVDSGQTSFYNGLDEGSYIISVNDDNECADQIEVQIRQYCCQPLVPNAFTPNGDEKNNIFTVLNKYDFDFLELQIYNRWGQKIFDEIGPNAKWDGTYNGKVCDMGVYIYLLKVTCDNTKQLTTFKGEITLLP